MANLDIAERRLPQDGRISLAVGGKPVDLRVSVLPTMFGESVVMRVLDRSNVSLDLEKLGLRQDGRWDGVMYQAPFKTKEGGWIVVKVPFERFQPTYHGRVLDNVPKARAAQLRSVGFLISDKQEGAFRLQIDWIKAYSGN